MMAGARKNGPEQGRPNMTDKCAGVRARRCPRTPAKCLIAQSGETGPYPPDLAAGAPFCRSLLRGRR